jgi:hypothetical protein
MLGELNSSAEPKSCAITSTSKRGDYRTTMFIEPLTANSSTVSGHIIHEDHGKVEKIEPTVFDSGVAAATSTLAKSTQNGGNRNITVNCKF